MFAGSEQRWDVCVKYVACFCLSICGLRVMEGQTEWARGARAGVVILNISVAKRMNCVYRKKRKRKILAGKHVACVGCP